MIWLATLALRFLSSPFGAGVLAVVAVFGSFHVGQRIGFANGVDHEQAEQAARDAEAAADIRERVEDALGAIGDDFSDDDVDAILRGLAGADG